MEMNRTHSCNVELAFLCCFDIQKSGTAAVLVAHIHETEVTKCLDGNYDFYYYCASFSKCTGRGQHASKSVSIKTVHLRSNKGREGARP